MKIEINKFKTVLDHFTRYLRGFLNTKVMFSDFILFSKKNWS